MPVCMYVCMYACMHVCVCLYTSSVCVASPGELLTKGVHAPFEAMHEWMLACGTSWSPCVCVCEGGREREGKSVNIHVYIHMYIYAHAHTHAHAYTRTHVHISFKKKSWQSRARMHAFLLQVPPEWNLYKHVHKYTSKRTNTLVFTYVSYLREMTELSGVSISEIYVLGLFDWLIDVAFITS